MSSHRAPFYQVDVERAPMSISCRRHQFRHGATTSNVLTNSQSGGAGRGTYQLIVTNAFSTKRVWRSRCRAQQQCHPFHSGCGLGGEWLSGTAASLNDVSGFSIPHNLFTVGANNYVFTNDVPPGQPAQSVLLAVLVERRVGPPPSKIRPQMTRRTTTTRSMA